MKGKNIAFLELKYGNIYGGYPNFYAVSEASLLVFEHETQRIFLESWENNADVEVVSVYSKTDEHGHTVGRGREVVNMRSRRRKLFKEDYRMNEDELQEAFYKLRPTRRPLKAFFLKNFRKYRIHEIVVFDGRRDIFLLEKAQVSFERIRIHDLQKDLNQETDYLFSLNKLAVIIGFEVDSHLRSNNLKYWLHPIAARQVVPKTAAFDAARLLMVHNEFHQHHDDFMRRAALLLNKIQSTKVGEE